MVEALQDLLRTDAGTATFTFVFIAALAVLLGANALYLVLSPGRRADRAQRGGRSPIQRAAGDILSGFTRWIASRNITPNQVTLVGLILVFFNCLYFLYHRNTFLFGTGLIVAYLFDMLDGVVARAQGTTSKFGGYLDAIVDRYQEVASYLAIGLVTEMWLPVFLVITGSMLTSYNKARAAIEIPVDNKGWPDLLGKGSRLFILCVALIGDNNLTWLLPFTLWALAAMTHFTGLQRVFRSYLLIRDAEASTGANGTTRLG